MLPGMLFFSIGRTPQAYLAATDRLRQVIVATAGGVATCLIALFVLTPRFGAAGAGAADSIGYLTFTALVLGRRRLTAPARLARYGAGQSARVSIRRTQDALRMARSPRLPRRVWAQTAAFVLVALAAGYAPMHLRLMVSLAAVVIILAWPDTGLILLAVTLPLSQTGFGACHDLEQGPGEPALGLPDRPGYHRSRQAARRGNRPWRRSRLWAMCCCHCNWPGDDNAGADWRTVLLLRCPIAVRARPCGPRWPDNGGHS